MTNEEAYLSSLNNFPIAYSFHIRPFKNSHPHAMFCLQVAWHSSLRRFIIAYPHPIGHRVASQTYVSLERTNLKRQFSRILNRRQNVKNESVYKVEIYGPCVISRSLYFMLFVNIFMNSPVLI